MLQIYISKKKHAIEYIYKDIINNNNISVVGKATIDNNTNINIREVFEHLLKNSPEIGNLKLLG